MLHEILQISCEVLPGEGEDCFALRLGEQSAFLCAADGCGGLGSRRYPQLENKTGAFLAAREAVRAFSCWLEDSWHAPSTDEDLRGLARSLEERLYRELSAFANENLQEMPSRITGTMQRILPAVFCALTQENDRLCFWWAGDTRGYIMDDDGLHKLTRDHLRGEPDAFEALYRDLPLTNLISAEKPGVIHVRSVQAAAPCIALVATDGVYGCLPTPMEMEMLLLDTLRSARHLKDWERRLRDQIAENAQDDATLLMLVYGYDHFDQMKTQLLARREKLQKQYITPVRRHKGDREYARAKWLQYKSSCDRTEDDHA